MDWKQVLQDRVEATKRPRVFCGDTCLDDDTHYMARVAVAIPIRCREDVLAFYQIVCEDYGVAVPAVKFTSRTYRWRRATCYHSHSGDDRILIHRKGENVETVAHELAHHILWCQLGYSGHSKSFAVTMRMVLKEALALLA